MVKDEKTDNLDGIVDMSHRCVDIETAKREKKRGGYNFTLKLPVFLLVCWSVYWLVTSGNEQKLNELSVVVFSCEKEKYSYRRR
jgi:hypothetical protein